MATIEQVEKLREKANVTYDEARTALEASGDDILEAMIYLEKKGKVAPPKNGGYYISNVQNESNNYEESNRSYKSESYQCDSFSKLIGKFFRWTRKIIALGNVNIFEVRRHNEAIISVPITVLVILLIFAFWIVVPLLVIGLFFGCRYIFRGPNIEKTDVNNYMDSAANAAENIKNEMKNHKDDK